MKDFSKSNILIVGDVMLDRYWWGSVTRISPEAPVPVVNLEKTTVTLGGAANVAANVAGLGAVPFLIGLIGADDESALFTEELKSRNIDAGFLCKNPQRQTIVKTRIVAHSQQIVRIDQESKMKITAAEEEILWEKTADLLDKVQIIIVSDYGKGIISEKLAERLITTGRKHNIPIMIDPKGKNYDKYRGATLLTPNRFELAEVCQLEDFQQATIEKAGGEMLSELALESLLITQGEDGMTLVETNKPIMHLPVTAKKVYDVTGAGDTVIASLAVAVSKGMSLTDAAKFANRCAGLVVEQVGTTAITQQMLDDLPPETFV